jgi:predicted RNA-binding protein with RPS1 domain
MEPFTNEIDINEIDDNYIDPEIFLLIGNSLVVDYQKTKSEENLSIIKEQEKKEQEKKEQEKKEKEKKENKRAIQILQEKIKEYEEQQKSKQKNKGLFSNLFTTKTDLFNENLETERYFYNKTLLNQLINFCKS